MPGEKWEYRNELLVFGRKRAATGWRYSRSGATTPWKQSLSQRSRPTVSPSALALPASFMHFQEPRRLIQKEKSPHFAIAPIIGWHWRARSMWQTPSMALGISSGGNCTPAKKRPALAAGTKRPHVRPCFFPRDYRFAGNRAVIHGVEFHEVNRHEIAA